MVTISQTKAFAKAVKRLKTNQKTDLDAAIRTLASSPELGELKKGDLAGIRVHKFHMVNQLVLLAYSYDEAKVSLTLLALGSHENFYRDLK